MNYLKTKFTQAVTPGGDSAREKYRENYERIFAAKGNSMSEYKDPSLGKRFYSILLGTLCVVILFMLIAGRCMVHK
jgi:hypothetical protein